MNAEEFRKWAHGVADWIADYMKTAEQFPVKPDCRPGDIKKRFPPAAPLNSESMDKLFSDFKDIIVPGMMHWQHPMYGGYFPSSRSGPSVLAEMLMAGLGAQCMTWLTSPAAAELEERVMEWLRDMTGLPVEFSGVIQDTASTATLVSILTAREQHTGFTINQNGYHAAHRFRVYASEHVHSSIDKAVRIAGIGQDNLVKIPSDEQFAMIPGKLDEAIRSDLRQGFTPLCVVTTLGTTSTTAVDPLKSIGVIAKQHNCWHHVDAAFAGTALILPEYRWMTEGIGTADTFVFNPHKWMFVNFDCTAYFVRDKNALTKTFSVMPEYLRTAEDDRVNNYRDWGIQLGRRFRALKLWFVLRYYGVRGLQEIIRNHIRWAHWMEEQMIASGDFEILAPVTFNLICFRYKPAELDDPQETDRINERLLNRLNDSGKIFLSHTRLNGRFVLRFVPGNIQLTHEHIRRAWNLIADTARRMEN